MSNFDAQYESLFGGIDVSNEPIGKANFEQEKQKTLCGGFLDVKELTQKIMKYLKTSQRTLALPVGEVMLNRKGGS